MTTCDCADQLDAEALRLLRNPGVRLMSDRLDESDAEHMPKIAEWLRGQKAPEACEDAAGSALRPEYVTEARP